MILFVEDDSALIDTCFMLLDLHGYDVSVARDAQDALVQMKWQTPELIITDWLMPGMDGITMAQHVRGQEAWCHIPIILISGSVPRLEGPPPFERFLRKPFLAETLMDNIGQLLERQPAEAAPAALR